jgi:hypothetical protein
MSTSLTNVWNNVIRLWDNTSYYSQTANFSLNNTFNTVGAQASLPNSNSTVNPESNYKLSSLFPLQSNLNEGTTGFQRTMKTSSTVGDWCNTMFIPYATSYRVMAMNNGGTVVSLNGSTVSTLSNRGNNQAFASLSVGDQIHCTQPFTLYQPSNPGLIGAYAGYAGFAFASRRDRATVKFYFQNLDTSRSVSVQVMFTATGGTNITSMTSVHTATLASAGTGNAGSNNTYSTTTTGNYYILADGPILAWRGQAPSNDCMPLYPMVLDGPIYGWFSSGGHTFSVNSAEVGRTNTGGGDTITGRSSANSTQTLCTPSSGRDNTYSQISGGPSGGSYFSGNCTAVYGASPQLTLFSAESQGDGNGSEMTPFTAKEAHGRGTIVGGFCAWNAFVSQGFSGSNNVYPNYGDVVMRFNSSGTFQDAEAFTGQNTTAPHSSKAYFGDGAGTGVSANSADFFLCNVEVQGFCDTDSSDKDETVNIMSNDINLPSATSYTICTLNSSKIGADSSADACAEILCNHSIELYSPSTSIAAGMVFFVDDEFFQPFGGNSKWFLHVAGRTTTPLQISSEGIVLSIGAC